jgi:ligand-binding SRPBCC domain-containing protein
MRTYRLERVQVLLREVEETFAFFADAFNLEAITPPWLHFHILTPPPVVMRQGTQIDFRLRWRGVPLRWRTRIEQWEENRQFVDTQFRGPYRLWSHLHTFEAVPEGTRMRDVVTYALPPDPLSLLVHRFIVGPDLVRIFDYRAERVAELLGADEQNASDPLWSIAGMARTDTGDGSINHDKYVYDEDQ